MTMNVESVPLREYRESQLAQLAAAEPSKHVVKMADIWGKAQATVPCPRCGAAKGEPCVDVRLPDLALHTQHYERVEAYRERT
jgi:hypothetical protein